MLAGNSAEVHADRTSEELSVARTHVSRARALMWLRKFGNHLGGVILVRIPNSMRYSRELCRQPKRRVVKRLFETVASLSQMVALQNGVQPPPLATDFSVCHSLSEFLISLSVSVSPTVSRSGRGPCEVRGAFGLMFRDYRCRSKSAHIRQSRPNSALGFHLKVLETFELLSSSLGSGTRVRRRTGSRLGRVGHGKWTKRAKEKAREREKKRERGIRGVFLRL